jgi:DNA-binding MarR family transcriptional regulator
MDDLLPNSQAEHAPTTAKLPAPLMVWTSFLLRQATLRVQARIAEALVPLGLRSAHHAALAVLAAGPLSQVALAAQLQTDRTTMVGLIDELEHAGLARRERNPYDRRAHEVTLTRDGAALLAHAHAQVNAADAAFFAPLAPDELEQLRTLLGRLIEAHDMTGETS